MIRLRVSTLEAFRRVVATEWGDEAELAERIERGQWAEGPSNWMMDAGTALHRILEGKADEGCDGALFSGAYCFDQTAANAILRHQGPGVRELTARRVFDLGGRKVEVEGTADHARGLVLRDAKTKFTTPDAKDYEPSLQWRYYLQIHGARLFVYDLCHFADPKDGYCEFKGIVSFRFWTYPGLEEECRVWLARFLDWAESRKLLPALERQPVEV